MAPLSPPRPFARTPSHLRTPCPSPLLRALLILLALSLSLSTLPHPSLAVTKAAKKSSTTTKTSSGTTTKSSSSRSSRSTGSSDSSGSSGTGSLRDRLALHHAQTLKISPDSRQPVPGLPSPDASACSCYSLRSPFRLYQSVCVCHNVCHNGTALLGNFGRRPCVAPRAPLRPVPGSVGVGGRVSALKPVSCRQMDNFRRFLAMALQEAPIAGGYAQRFPRWRRSRRSITWREGTTYLQPLEKSDVNISHFFGKVGQLLLINNASVVPGLPYTVDRFMFPRHPNVLETMVAAGRQGWHVTVLRQLVAMASARVLGSSDPLKDQPGLVARRFYGKRPLMNGLVEFEGPLLSASERRPICFDRLIIPGHLKAITYPGGPDEAEQFKRALQHDLRMSPPPPLEGNTPRARARKPVQVLYVARNAVLTRERRVLLPDSEKALLKMLKTMGFKVRTLDFTSLPFRAQYDAVLSSEIVVGLHGAALTNAAALARNSSILLEIMPYRVFHPLYYFMAVNAGVTYMLHQATRGSSSHPRDADFEDKYSVRQCQNVHECKEFFTHRRPVELTKTDLEELSALLLQARQIVVEARWNVNWAGRKLKKRYDNLCVAKRRDIRCRMGLVRSPIADLDTECVVKMDCSGRKLSTTDDLDEIL